MRSACLLLLSVLAAATADQPVHTGKCAATRSTRSGLAKECTVCAGCHQSLPNCSCCQPVYDNTQFTITPSRARSTRCAMNTRAPNVAIHSLRIAATHRGIHHALQFPDQWKTAKILGSTCVLLRKQSARQAAAIATTA